jgi:single-stranded-DNA-specific exonuclease
MGETSEDFVLGVSNSVSGRAWRLRHDDDRLAEAIAQRADVPEIVARVMAGRGVALEDAESFLSPSLRDLLPDPSSFLDMDKAADRIADALKSGDGITIFGDYDVDGATSAALLVRFIRSIGGDAAIYVPDRMKEGYGPNAKALESIAASGAKVVITVDCGTLAFEALAAGKAAGLDIIVVDHHAADPALPEAVAVINPNRIDEDAGHSELAAVGVAYLLVVAINRTLRKRGWYASRPEPDLLQWLDIVALGTVCDVVPLVGLNRAFVHQGLRVMASRRNKGLAALSDVGGIQETIGAYHLGFILGPRVNAGGRIGQSDLGARLLSSDNNAETTEIAAKLDAHNAERRDIESKILEEAMAAAEAQTDAGVIVVSDPSWHPGVVGIIASRLKDKFRRPALVIGYVDGLGKGSARSVPGFDIGAAVISARQGGLIINGGGHKMAAGLTVESDKIAALADHLNERAKDQPREESNRLGLDGVLAVTGATRDLTDLLERAGPYGSGNKEPRFAFADARIVKSDLVGSDHVRCIFSGAASGRIKGIIFNAASTELGQFLLNHRRAPVHVAGRLRQDNWQGREDVQLMIDDAAPA